MIGIKTKRRVIVPIVSSCLMRGSAVDVGLGKGKT